MTETDAATGTGAGEAGSGALSAVGTPRHDALAGLKVVEFAQNAAVPECGRLLAGWGATVVKIEPPTGDAMRHLAGIAPNEGRGYALINPGKQSVCLDLTHDGAQEVIDRLIAWADVALVGLKLTDVERFGLTWERASSINPQLIELVFNAFGPEGPHAARGGYDVLVQGMSGVGWMMNRSGGGFPRPTRPAVFDFSSGMMASAALLLALRHRDATGEGQRVDASLLGTAVNLGIPVVGHFERDSESIAQLDEDLALMRQAQADFDDQRSFYDARVVAAGGAFQVYFRHYRTADGLLSVAGLSPDLIAKFHDVTGLDRPPAGARVESEEFQALISGAEALFLTRSTAEWLEVLQAAGYPCAPYNLPHEAAFDEQVRANDYTVDLDHPGIGRYTAAGMPVGFSSLESKIRGPSPLLDEHTDVVLAELGYDADAVAGLRSAGIVGAA